MNQSSLLNISSDGRRISFVEAGWHDIVVQARSGFVQHIEEAGDTASGIEVFRVPGSLEIPLKCQLLARSGRYQVIVAAGLIVDGGIYRHDFVAATVLDGIMRVQLDTGVPILSVVLTPHYFNDGQEHRQFFHDHFLVKGREAAQACLQLITGEAKAA